MRFCYSINSYSDDCCYLLFLILIIRNHSNEADTSKARCSHARMGGLPEKTNQSKSESEAAVGVGKIKRLK